jgi:hypothetical protein
LQEGPDEIPELSKAEGTVNKIETAGTPSVGVTVLDAGHVISGRASSAIVKGKEHVDVRPALSVAVQETVVVVPTV